MNKNIKRILKIVLTIIIALILSFFVYTSFYYKADDTARKILNSENVSQKKDDIIEIASNKSVDKAIIFYPGAKVEYTSYLPILKKISEQSNVKIFLVHMPFNLAVLNQNAADSIISQNSDIKEWYLAGHSMGGAMASSYASNNKETVKGLILLGAYIYGDFPEEKSLTIYGEYNTSVKEKINYSKNIVEIKGGNHAQFGNYGKQNGDKDATISSEEQQNIAVKEIIKFLNK